jgi:hypothetical protein
MQSAQVQPAVGRESQSMTDATLTNTITALESERGHGQKRYDRVL